jgi:hypothetical protein
VLNFAAKKHFGLVDIGQIGLDMFTRISREFEASGIIC